jgi:hypothetical protein
VIFEAVADGRLHLAGVVVLKPHLTSANVAELVASATHKTRRQIEKLVAERFPGQAPPERCVERTVASPVAQLSPGTVQFFSGSAEAIVSRRALAPDTPPPVSPALASLPRVASVAPRTYSLQATLDEEAYEHLQRAQELRGRASATTSLGEVLGKALKLLVADLEKKKLGAIPLPSQRPSRRSENPRHIPAHVKREVWKRDQGRCTFVGDQGKRCDARHGLEFDHVFPVARGGESTVENVRLLCRAHNQLEAERALGWELMRAKRQAAAERRVEPRSSALSEPRPPASSS